MRSDNNSAHGFVRQNRVTKNFDKSQEISFDKDQYFKEILSDTLDERKLNVFPYHVFPSKICEIITQTNKHLNFPVDFISASILYTTSVAIGNNFKIEVMNGWQEGAVLYMALVASPGTNKSHPLSFAIAPLLEQDKINNRIYRQEKTNYDIAVKAAKKAKTDMPIPPIKKKIILTDFTPEALGEVHKNNPKGIGVYIDELAGWFKNFNRYKPGSEMEFWLSSWSGKSINIDRRSAEPIFISSSFISVIGTTQNGVLKDMSQEGRNQNGFVERILFVIPEDLTKPYWSETEISSSIVDDWHSTINTLLKVPEKFDSNGLLIPDLLRFTPSANRLLRKWQKLNSDIYNSSDNDYIKGLYSKMEVYVIRFALILEMLNFACDKIPRNEISFKSVKGAIELGQYFLRSAIKANLIMNGKKASDANPRLFELYNALPDTFTTMQALLIGKEIGIPERTLKRFLKEELFVSTQRGEYKKI